MTSFGPLEFEHQGEIPERPAQNRRHDLSSLYSSLERTIWEFDELQPEESPFSKSSIRGLAGSPQWLLQSRARGMFILPQHHNERVVSQELSESDHSFRISDFVSQAINSHADSINNSIFYGDKNVSGTNEDHNVGSLLEKSVVSNEFDGHFIDSFENEVQSIDHFNAVASNKDSKQSRVQPPEFCLTAYKDSSVKSRSMDETMLQEKVPKIKENQSVTSGLDERLQRVEAMLECLIGPDVTISTTPQLGKLNTPDEAVSHSNDHHDPTMSTMPNLGKLNTPAEVMSQESDSFSLASSFNPFGTPTPSHQSHSDSVHIEDLLKEIEALKAQLAAKEDSIASNNPNVTSRTPGAKPKRKLPSRIKNFLFS